MATSNQRPLGRLWAAAFGALVATSASAQSLPTPPGGSFSEEGERLDPSELSGSCDPQKRTARYRGKAIPIHLSSGWVEVVVPEAIQGLMVNDPGGVQVRESDAFSDRFFLKSEQDSYQSLAHVHGQSGETYLLDLATRHGCPDASVRVRPGVEAPEGGGSAPVEDESLMVKMLRGEPVSGRYTREQVSGSPKDRLVFRQGPVHFYLAEVYRSPNEAGFVLEVVNRGRSGFRVNIEGMDFADERLTEQFGDIREVAMLPTTRRLAPSPAYTSGAIQAPHRGLVYIYSHTDGGA